MPLAEMMRPANTRISLLLLVGGGILAGAAAGQIALFGLLIILVYGVATIGNDLRDEDIDRANRRATPLATGAVTRRQAWVAASCCLAAVAAAQLWLAQPTGVVFTVAYLSLAAAYSTPGVALEDRGLLATFTLSTCYFVLPLWSARRLGGRPVGAILVAALLLGAAGVLHKDFKDEVGDRRFGKKTPLVRYGARSIITMSVALAMGGGALLVGLSHHRLLAVMLLAAAGCALAHPVTRPGRCPGGVQWYYLLAACALLASC